MANIIDEAKKKQKNPFDIPVAPANPIILPSTNPTPETIAQKGTPGTVYNPTPEEAAAQQQAGQDFIHQREAKAIELMSLGHSATGATRLANMALSSQTEKQTGTLPQLSAEQATALNEASQLNAPPSSAPSGDNQILGFANARGVIEQARNNYEQLANAKAGTLAGSGAKLAQQGIETGIKAGTAFFNRWLPGALEGDVQDVKESVTGFSQSVQKINDYINAVNRGEMDALQATKHIQEELNNISVEEGKLKGLTKDYYGQKLSRGLDELTKIEAFRRAGLPILMARLNSAIVTPNPNNVLNVITPDLANQ